MVLRPVLLTVLVSGSARFECRTDLPIWRDIWETYTSLRHSDSFDYSTALRFRMLLHETVLNNHTAVLDCNSGVIAGYMLIASKVEKSEPEVAYRSLQMAMVFVYTLRYTKQRIPKSVEIEWGISKDDLSKRIIEMKSKFGNVVKTQHSVVGVQTKIGIVSICAYPENRNLILDKITPLNRQKYAHLHGYDAIIYTSHPVGPNSSVSIQHSKLELMRTLVDSRKYDWLMWTDCDSVIINRNRKIEDIIAEYVEDDSADLLITEELFGLSSANWIIRSSQWSSNFLAQAFDIAHNQLPLLGDQDAIISLAIGRGQLDNHIKIIPQNVINAYDALNSFAMGGGGYEPGDLLITFPQCQDENCNPLFYEAFKASEDGSIPSANRTVTQLRVFGPVGELLNFKL